MLQEKDMKILYIINHLRTGGAQRLIVDLAEQFASHESEEIGILTIMDSENTAFYQKIKNHPKIKLHEIKSGKNILSAIHKTRKIIREYDVIHSHLFPAGYFAAIANLCINKPTVYTEHSTYNRRRDKKYLLPLERWIYSRYDFITTISESARENLIGWLHQNKFEKKTKTICNGVDLRRFEIAKQDLSPSRLFGKEGKAIIMISRFTKAKDQAAVIRSLPLISDKSVFAVFVGDGETKLKCEELARDLGVEDRCCFLGTRNDIPELIQCATIGIQSSNWEGFGLTAIEMMAGGLPVIASDVKGLADVIKDAGILFPKGDEVSLAEAVNSLLYDKESFSIIREKCRLRALEYDINTTEGRFRELYQEAISTRKK